MERNETILTGITIVGVLATLGFIIHGGFMDRKARIETCEKAEPNQVVLCLNTIK